MGIFDRLFGKGKPSGNVEGATGTAPAPARTGPPTDDEIIEIAKRVTPPASEVTHYFICSGNPSLIDAFQGILRVGTPAYGGSAAQYRASGSTLGERQTEAQTSGLAFNGTRYMGKSGSEVASMADVLSGLKTEAYSGGCSVAYAAVGPSGREWVQEVYDTLLGEAMGQGILPFSMYVTSDPAAAEYLLGSIR
jgi:hypothetical protein